MRIILKNIVVVVLSVVLFSSSVCAIAAENEYSLNDNAKSSVSDFFDPNNIIITIDGYGYNAQEFMNRVIEYTIESEPIETMKAKNGSKIKFEYNEYRQRTKKVTEKGSTIYTYDNSNNLKTEILPNGENIEYLYSLKDGETAESITYKNVTYNYIIDDNGIIAGLLNENNQTVCEYVYDKNGLTKHIIEINGEKKINHQDDSGDDFIGCVNSIRYDGEYYDSETDMYCTNKGSYYDTMKNEVIGGSAYVDMKKLFGDQYNALSRIDNASNTISSLSISPTEQMELIAAAVQCYNNTINENTSAYSGTTWYTNFNSLSMYYKLAARIIYAENNYTSTNTTMNDYLQYNRQGIAWEITNRLLEDKYRYYNGKSLFFSSTASPSLYSILTKSGAFASLNTANAKGLMDPSNQAYQQAFWLACTIKVCSSFDQWNAVVPRPAGVTSQCYNKGALTTSSSPYYKWRYVKFPGWTTDYTDASSYTVFTYYSSIGKFNILHSYKTAYETLYIDSVYY